MHDSATREAALRDWVSARGCAASALTPASADASFRRYFRVQIDGVSRIVMDAPPTHEESRGFVALAAHLREAGLKAPEVFAADFEQGFVLLEDLGDTHFLARLGNADFADNLYASALNALVQIQTRVDCEGLPDFVETCFERELGLFTDWLLERWLGIRTDSGMLATGLDNLSALLRRGLVEQPKVFVHRDYHSRNLMAPVDPAADPRPGILDFQDAVTGPICYDVVSLLRDCYIAWPWARVAGWFADYREALVAAGRADLPRDMEVWQRWFDLTATQRHMKAAGIFARLALRDGKFGYLNDIPRTLGYIEQAAERTPELAWLAALVREQIQPAVAERLAERARSAPAGEALLGQGAGDS